MSIPPEMIYRYRYRQDGISLIELVIFIVIVSTSVVGILSVMSVTTRASADPMLRKQAIAIAESLLEEIELQPFTWCDPDDANAATASSTAGCANPLNIEGFGATPVIPETRGSLTAPFDNVYDYAGTASGVVGYSMTGIRGADNAAIASLANYNATVTISQDPVGGVPAAASLRIDVRVQSGTNVDITLTGYRLRYSPNTTP